MTKQQEIDALEKFYAGLPVNSYVHHILAGVPQYAACLISADLAFPALGEIQAKKTEFDELKAAVKELRETRAKLETEVAKLEYRRGQAPDEIRHIVKVAIQKIGDLESWARA